MKHVLRFNVTHMKLFNLPQNPEMQGINQTIPIVVQHYM